ncbi:3-methyl-2-oxobutanoate hydroxymethyltransferase [Aureibacter tunicatorum]|uniref:3-methyl-2-oxobutanoate hydroxymethyltransferase n=1 Tax=Aureibacter tunicatorum TaxID=866807 RepID=A0AAE4BST8_9BACT|nr:3-methyl-2-oxobutanoate hydroxymethyltransferase [Aureibacter tunicatorum]MDR6240116.1 3-methyl-2-oxobutanoate hydroxymethyltransferase [Aureibacter tunicatorum]BDD06003.1 3-methyl-2-oxobutanoate hydroxymethyltransferase [Aureibacter tunicatorum]
MSLIRNFRKLKSQGKKLVVVTSYDYWSARIISMTNVDAVLVGDCSSMVMHGHENTLSTSIDQMVAHTEAVKKGVGDKFIIASFPYMACRKGIYYATETAEKLIKAGAQAIKIEGAFGNEAIINHLVESGIPVVGHIGLKPSHHHSVGGFKVQGKLEIDADKIVEEGKLFEKLGCFSIVIEAVPPQVAQRVTSQVLIPTIGVGAGKDVDGQALVLQDMLGLSTDFKPKFVRKYLDGAGLFVNALNQFVNDVHHEEFPADRETYTKKEKPILSELSLN